MVTLVCDAPLHSIEIRQSGPLDSVREAVGKGEWFGEWSEVMNQRWVDSQPRHGEFQYRHRFGVGNMVFFAAWAALDDVETAIYSSAMDAFREALTRWKIADDAMRVSHRFTLELWRRAGRNVCLSEIIRRNYPNSEFSPAEQSELRTHVDAVRQAKIVLGSAILATHNLSRFQCRLTENGATGKHWLFRNGMIWSSKTTLTDEQWTALVENQYKSNQLAILRAMSISSGANNSRVISVEVRREVWRRDEGRCCVCQSQERLEFDHVIPVSMGGSNTARNIQLLCETCNRLKSSTLG